MPTGYTAKLVEEEGNQSFQEFALMCARAFGACVMQRDDDSNDLPKFGKPSSFYQDRLDKAFASYQKYYFIPIKEAFIESIREFQKNRDYLKEKIEKTKKIREKLEKMLESARDFTPPNSDFLEFKNFMVDQLEQTINWDGDPSYYQRELGLRPLNGREWKEERLKQAKKDIEYYTEELKKELNRVCDRNDWIIKLMEAVKNEG